VTQLYGPRGAVTGTDENGGHLTGLASWKEVARCAPAREILRVILALNPHQSRAVAVGIGEGVDRRGIFVLAAELSPRGGSWGLG